MGFLRHILLLALLAAAGGAPAGDIGAGWLFPGAQQYVYRVKADVSSGSLLPSGASRWRLDAELRVQAHNATRIGMRLDSIQTSLYNSNSESPGGHQSPHSLPSEASALARPWEAIYWLESGVLVSVQLADDEPLWSANIKRAFAVSLQLVRVNSTDALFSKSYTVVEPCLHDTCQTVYSGADGTTVRKSHAVPASTRGYGRSIWFSVRPDICTRDLKQPFIGNAERVYQLDERGLLSMELKSSLEYHSHNHLLAVVTSLSLNRDHVSPLDPDTKPALNSSYHFYYPHTYNEPTNGRRVVSQQDLITRTRELLTRVSENIDRDNVVKDADKIHNLDLIELHKVMTQLNADSLKIINNELHVGTSYLTETSRNVFFEVLPHVRSADSARLVKYLVVEFSDQKFEDATALSLIRKLPFSVAEYSEQLLADMDDLLNLGPDVPADIRHASILSFATLVFHTYINGGCSAVVFEEYVTNYFSLYTACPGYEDRLVWLQGLANLQLGNVASYLGPLVQNAAASRHERFLAIWATLPLVPFQPESTSSLYWPILTNPKEHIQLRVSALVMLLFGEQSAGRVLSLHHYVSSCDDNHLKRFWCTTVRSFEKSTFSCFHPLAKLTSYVSELIQCPDQSFWATGNYIVDTSDDARDSAAMAQLWSVADPATGLPAVAYLTINTNQAGLLTNQIGVMVKAEGVTASFLSKLFALNSEEVHLDVLAQLLKQMKVETMTPDKVHIELVVTIQGKTVYATHLNQSTFDSWTGSSMIDSIKNFLMSESHINQQLIQFPLQTDLNLPTELGTPVTLQSVWSTFVSVRGTMTSPSTPEELLKKNDVHLRYHGTALTTLSTYGPLLGSEHSVRVEQSLVAHLPLKFELSLSLIKKALQLTWLNEDPTGGVALHTRSQVSLDVGPGRDLKQLCSNCRGTYTIRANARSGDQVDHSGFYFDCDRPMSGVELLEKLLDSNRANYDFFSSLRPSLIAVHGLYLLSVPPAGACGVIVPSRSPLHLPRGAALLLALRLERAELAAELAQTVGFSHSVTLKDMKPSGETYLTLNGTTFLENTSEKLRIAVWLAGYQPKAIDINRRHWQICLEETDFYRVPGDQDISLYPGPFQGQLKIVHAATAHHVPKSCPETGTVFNLEYSGHPMVNYSSQEVTRYFDLKVYGKNLPKLTFLSELGVGQVAAVGQILQKITTDPLNVTASVVEKNGLADVTIDHGPKWQFHTENFNWLLDNWSNMQLLKKFGIYRECRLQQNTIYTLDGTVDQLPHLSCPESLVLADCTAKPRFALLRLRDGGFKLYTGGNYVTVRQQIGAAPLVSVNGGAPVDYSGGYRFPQGDSFYDFQVSEAAGAVRVSSRLSGVQLYSRPSEVVVLVPDTYMAVACGACARSRPYSLCP